MSETSLLVMIGVLVMFVAFGLALGWVSRRAG